MTTGIPDPTVPTAFTKTEKAGGGSFSGASSRHIPKYHRPRIRNNTRTSKTPKKTANAALFQRFQRRTCRLSIVISFNRFHGSRSKQTKRTIKAVTETTLPHDTASASVEEAGRKNSTDIHNIPAVANRSVHTSLNAKPSFRAHLSKFSRIALPIFRTVCSNCQAAMFPVSACSDEGSAIRSSTVSGHAVPISILDRTAKGEIARRKKTVCGRKERRREFRRRRPDAGHLNEQFHA